MPDYPVVVNRTHNYRLPLARTTERLRRSGRRLNRKFAVLNVIGPAVLICGATASAIMHPLALLSEDLAGRVTAYTGVHIKPENTVAVEAAAGSAAASFDTSSPQLDTSAPEAAAAGSSGGAVGSAIPAANRSGEASMPLPLPDDPSSVPVSAALTQEPAKDAAVPAGFSERVASRFPASSSSASLATLALASTLPPQALREAPGSVSIDTRAAITEQPSVPPFNSAALPSLSGGQAPSQPQSAKGVGGGGDTAQYAALALNAAGAPGAVCEAALRGLAQATVIRFDKGSAVVPPKEANAIRTLASAVSDCPDVKIDVGGHADKSGEQLGNLQLSWQRAEAVIKVIKTLGFKPDRFSPVGYSATRPLSVEPGAQSQAINRRVEFLVR